MVKGKILIIDDDPAAFEIIQSFLSDIFYKHNFLYAETGGQGLSILDKVKVSVVLIDFYMPGINGLETIKAIRTKEQLKDLPLILISGYALNPIFEREVKKHTFACIPKQHIWHDLKPIIKRILREKYVMSEIL